MSGAELISNERGQSKPGTALSGTERNEKEDFIDQEYAQNNHSPTNIQKQSPVQEEGKD